MDSKLVDRCAREFEDQVRHSAEELFELLQACCPEDVDEVEVPFIGGTFDPRAPKQDWPVKQLIKAMATRAFCKIWGPTYPPLPLSVDDIEEMQGDPDPLLMLWSQVGAQLRGLGWELRRMDIFHEYCEGRRRAGTVPG